MTTLDLLRWAENADSYPVVLFVTSADGRVRWLNGHWRRLTGVPNEAMLDSGWQDALHPDDGAGASQAWFDALRDGTTYVREVRLRLADGTFHWFLCRAQPVHGPDARISHWLGVLQDVDDLKEIERALLKSEVKFRALADNIDPIVWIADDEWNAAYLNRRWSEYTGIPVEEALHEGWQRAFRPEDRAFIRAGLRSGRQTGALSFVHQLYHAPSESYRWVHLCAHHVADALGDNAQWFATLTDIHDAKLSMERKDRVIDTFQQALLPRQTVPIPNAGCSSVYVAATEESRVGGDWYDCFEISEQRYGVSIGDVVGHGITASAAMARIRQYMSAAAEDESDPRAILRRCNAFIRRRKLPLATALYGVLDLERRTFEFASAGHPGIIVVRGNSASVETSEGLPLGVVADVEYASRTIALEDVGMLALYTDGVLEFSRDVIATERLLLRNAIDVSSLPNTASRAAELVDRTLDGHRATDDVAMLVLSFCDGPGATVSHCTSRSIMSWQFDSSEPDAAYRVIRRVLAFIDAQAMPETDLCDVKCVLGELVANVVEHAPGPVQVEVDWSLARPLLRMRDSGPGFALKAALPEDQLSEGGRGLFLISALADDLRVACNYDEGGTEVSVSLRLHKRP